MVERLKAERKHNWVRPPPARQLEKEEAHQSLPVFPLLLVRVGESVPRHVSYYHLCPESAFREAGRIFRAKVDKVREVWYSKPPAAGTGIYLNALNYKRT